MGTKRRLRATNRGPVARAVYDRHNRYKRITFPELKLTPPPERPILSRLGAGHLSGDA